MTIIDLITPADYAILRETAREAIAARQGAARGTETDEDDGEAWDSE